MSEAFDTAWSVLKALREHQMFTEAPPRHNLKPQGSRYSYSDEYTKPLADDSGARSHGTVHPAIASMLRRRRNPDGTPTNKYSIRPANLNLDVGRKIEPDLPPWKESRAPSGTVGKYITSSPEENMQNYDYKRNYMPGIHFDYSVDARNQPIDLNHPAPYTDSAGRVADYLAPQEMRNEIGAPRWDGSKWEYVTEAL
jgi:hypothetical protein